VASPRADRACGLLFDVKAANAQSAPEYIIYDLGVIRSTGGATSKALGINNLGQVCGEATATPSPGSQKHAFLWLFSPAFGLTAQVMHDLNTVHGLTLTGPSLAHDLNINGRIVGRSGAEGSHVARMWVIATGSASSSSLGFLPFGSVSVAHAVNDVDVSGFTTIVGESATNGYCGPPTAEFRGFQYVIDPTTEMEELPPPNDTGVGAALDVNNDIDDDPTPDILGYSATCQGVAVLCQSLEDAAHWSGASTGLELGPYDEPGQHRATGVNDADNVVGWCFEDFFLPACTRRALFWTNSDAFPVNLGLISPLDTTHGTLANAISDPGLSGERVIVGQDVTVFAALAWLGSPGSWTVRELNKSPHLPDLNPDPIEVDPCGWDQLTDAIDANDNGWIVGEGVRQPGVAGSNRGYLLIPAFPCLADLTGDCIVDGADLGQLLLRWGACPMGSSCVRCRPNTNPCIADFNCDGMVLGDDLGQLLLHWTGTETCGPECLSVGGGSFAGGGGEGGSAPEGAVMLEGVPDLTQIIADLVESGQMDLVVWLLEFYGDSNQ
jgi:probable HAF family extracellular repeat protein